MKFVLNYSVSSLVLITFLFSMSLCHISEGFFLLFPLYTFVSKDAFHYQKVFVRGTLRILITQMIIFKEDFHGLL